METDAYYAHVRSEIDPLVPARIGRVLEIGCGDGATMAWLRHSREVGFAAGIEIVPEAGEKARRVFDEVAIAPVDEAAPDFAGAAFDLMLALDVLEHLPRPDATLAHLRQRLRPGGLLVASIPNIGHYTVSWPLFRRGRWDYADEGHLDRTHLRFFYRDSAVALFEQAGFSVERVETTTQHPNLFQPFGWKSRQARWYSRKILDTAGFPSHLSVFQFLIAARAP